jgi:hypothetical protein
MHAFIMHMHTYMYLATNRSSICMFPYKGIDWNRDINIKACVWIENFIMGRVFRTLIIMARQTENEKKKRGIVLCLMGS